MQINATTLVDMTAGTTTTARRPQDAPAASATSGEPARLLDPQPTIDPALGSDRMHGLPGSTSSEL